MLCLFAVIQLALARTGDGSSVCVLSNQASPIADDYTSSGNGTLACDQGQDVVYPEGAPGFVYDPTGYLLTLPGRQVSQHQAGYSICPSRCSPDSNAKRYWYQKLAYNKL